jgi:hypothetical protein
MSEHRVFMSYSIEDRPLLASAVKWLRESELRSAEIDDPAEWGAAGTDVRTIIGAKMRQADALVLLWSDRAAKSAWVQYEVGMAQALGVPIRVLLASGSRAKLPLGLAKTKVFQLAPVEPSANSLAPDATANASISSALARPKQS